LAEGEASTSDKSDKVKESKSFEHFFSLLGMTREQIIAVLGGNPTPVDEGGLDFGKTGIRVWFEYGKGANEIKVKCLYYE
jgi:hypothetical protein